MFYINKITSDSVIDYAAEELKKYLRMMMPDGGDVIINSDPLAREGFRLGLMSAFGLDMYPLLENVIPRFAISKRNEWMIDKADLIIAFVNHEYGGA